MVKVLHILLNDEEFEKLKELKGGRTWKQFLIDPLLKEGDESERERPNVRASA